MKDKTKLIHEGRNPAEHFGAVNTPVYHVSTVLFETVKELNQFTTARMSYGRHGSPGTQALCEALCALEHADGCILTSSGVQAINVALLAFLKPGDHLLMVDSVYSPTRIFCDGLLKDFGITTSYYDPLVGANITDHLQANTKVVFLESPGSLSFEVQDVPAIVKAVKKTNESIITMLDNTWATPLFYKPLDHGVDVSLQAITKYIGGHADVMMGSIAYKETHKTVLEQTRYQMGLSVGPDDAYLALRGLRSLSARLQRHQDNGLTVAKWLQQREGVSRVIHPGLEGDAGHAIWTRDFKGASSLFGFALGDGTRAQVEAMLDHMSLFGMGFSWGGYESLLIPCNVARNRTATTWDMKEQYFRIHVGLEDPDDLIADLDAAITRFYEAA